MRVSSEEFQHIPLRVHRFLADVPLHDVWAFQLQQNATKKTFGDFRALLSSRQMQTISPVVRLLFNVRAALGRFFRWDNHSQERLAMSYIHRLTDDDRKRSIREPGGVTVEPFRLIYEFENEALEEAINATVHAFSLMTMQPVAGGHIVYWAIYVKKISQWTPVYMALINPFRRLLVYPALIRKVERLWNQY